MSILNNSRRFFSRIPFWYFVTGSIALYIALRWGISLISGRSLWDTVDSALSNTLDNMIAGLGFAIVVWATKDSVRQFLEADRNFLTKPIDSIHALADALEQAVQRHRNAFRSEVESVQNIFICIILPMHLSSKLVDHMCSPDDSLKEITKSRLNDFNAYINKVTDSSNGAYDIRVFGRTGLPVIDGATRAEIIAKYILPGVFPGTSQLGLHYNRDEEGVIIFGECDLSSPSKVKQVTEVISFSFDDEYKAIDGSSCIDTHVASRRLDFHLKKVEKIYETEHHWMNNTKDDIIIMSDNKFRNLENIVTEFFSWVRPKSIKTTTDSANKSTDEQAELSQAL
ncbi:hypothetical protein [Azospirillum sp. B510]|uniref:hypothetical protein n=1 Tax=Azospirillum sp. (strain B510) TaxID=137722 RepID=UPI0011D0A20F|nr:hypothetical protein [Azospirillum sp. B510]